MSNTHSKGQALSLEPVTVSAVAWGPDQKVFELEPLGFYGANGVRTVRLQAVAYTGAGELLVKDSHGIEIFSGSAADLTAVATGQYITITAPLQYTTMLGSSGTIYFYGEFV